jgi:hypothetical protein
MTNQTTNRHKKKGELVDHPGGRELHWIKGTPELATPRYTHVEKLERRTQPVTSAAHGLSTSSGIHHQTPGLTQNGYNASG